MTSVSDFPWGGTYQAGAHRCPCSGDIGGGSNSPCSRGTFLAGAPRCVCNSEGVGELNTPCSRESLSSLSGGRSQAGAPRSHCNGDDDGDSNSPCSGRQFPITSVSELPKRRQFTSSCPCNDSTWAAGPSALILCNSFEEALPR